MKLITTALLAAGMASLAACGGSGANNAATANNAVEALPPVENVGDLNAPAPAPAELNAGNAAGVDAAGNAAATSGAGNGL